MAFRYVVKKRVFGFDKSKSEKYVAASFSIGEISYDRLCDQVTKEGMAPRGVVKMVMDGLIDALSTYVSLGATVKLGDFGTIRPGLNCKSQSEAKDVTRRQHLPAETDPHSRKKAERYGKELRNNAYLDQRRGDCYRWRQ